MIPKYDYESMADRMIYNSIRGNESLKASWQSLRQRSLLGPFQRPDHPLVGKGYNSVNRYGAMLRASNFMLSILRNMGR